jgi:hypothetical protein
MQGQCPMDTRALIYDAGPSESLKGGDLGLKDFNFAVTATDAERKFPDGI